MNVITVSREYGAGGGETARQLGAALGWQVLDRELLDQAAAIEHVPDAEIERLDEQAIGLLDRLSFHPAHKRYMHGLTEAVQNAAAKGKVVLVGRGTRQILDDLPGAFHLRLVAPLDWRAERMERQEGWTLAEARTRCQEVDRTRRRFTAYFFGKNVEVPESYDLVANTQHLPLDEVVALVTAVVRNDWPKHIPEAMGRRVLTVSRELGAVDASFTGKLGERLDLEVFDRELLEREALQLGVAVSELEKVDDELATVRQREPGTLAQRYYDALGRMMHGLVGRSDVLLVGRGGSQFLREHLLALHVRLVASAEERLRHVQQERGVSEEEARKRIAGSDAARRNVYKAFFGTDWADPLQYHLTVNVGRLQERALDLVAMAATRYWGRR